MEDEINFLVPLLCCVLSLVSGPSQKHLKKHQSKHDQTKGAAHYQTTRRIDM